MSTTQTYTVTGMTCGHCVASVTEEVQEIAGVENVDVVLETGSLTITSAEPVDDAAVHDRGRGSRVPARMSVTVKLLGFLVALVAIFGGAVGIGRAVGPIDSSPAADHGDMGGRWATTWTAAWTSPAPPSIPKGLMVSQNGYTFRLDRAPSPPGPPCRCPSPSRAPTETPSRSTTWSTRRSST